MALGITISSGLTLQQNPVLLAGAGLAPLMFDWIGAVIERILKPQGSDSTPHMTVPPTTSVGGTVTSS